MTIGDTITRLSFNTVTQNKNTLSSYIYDPFGGVFDVDTDGEVEEVVNRVPCVAEAVHRFLPGEGAFVPVGTVEHRPPTQPPEHVQERLHPTGFDRGCDTTIRNFDNERAR